jgi:serine/threonine-protein kinase RsbW
MDTYAMEFTNEDLSRARRAALRLADEHGMRGDRATDLVIAVNEAVSNALRYGGGQGRLRLWREGVTLHCEVADSGPGMRSRHLADPRSPASLKVGGRGIWLIHRLADRVAISTGPQGTAVRIAMEIS